jgi:hypothetical protein
MAVELWYERWPNSRAEQDVLIELYSSLYHQRERFVLAADFQVGRTPGVIFDGDPRARPNVIGREQQLGDTHALKNNTIVAFGPASFTFLLYEAET